MFSRDVDNHVVMILGPNPMDKVSGAINNCSRKVGEATRHAENMVDNIWNHGEFFFSLFFLLHHFKMESIAYQI